ncbi:copia protein, partial [Tanacetum coccineum]
IIFEAGLLEAKPANIPLEQHHRLALADDEELRDPECYRRLVGRLIYLTITRHEPCYYVHVLSRFMQHPLEEHWKAIVRVVRSIKDSHGQGILLCVYNGLLLYGYCDSDWASYPVTRRSLIGYFVLFRNSPISWKKKKQHIMSRSSSEAKYRLMATTRCELKWLKGLLNSLGVTHPKPMRLFFDNQVALHIVANPVFHERTKHIEVDCHFVHDEILSGNLAPSYVHTSTQLVDIFTKALGNQQFHDILSNSIFCRLLHSLHVRMLIGQVASLLGVLLQDIVFFVNNLLSLSSKRSTLYFFQVLKPSTGNVANGLLKLPGCWISFAKFIILYN